MPWGSSRRPSRSQPLQRSSPSFERRTRHQSLAPRPPRTVHDARVIGLAPRLTDERRNHSFLSMSRDGTDVVVVPEGNLADIDRDLAHLAWTEEIRLVQAGDERAGIRSNNLESVKIDSSVDRK